MTTEYVSVEQNLFPLPYRRTWLADFLNSPPELLPSAGEVGPIILIQRPYGEYVNAIVNHHLTSVVAAIESVIFPDVPGVVSLRHDATAEESATALATNQCFYLSNDPSAGNYAAVMESRVAINLQFDPDALMAVGFSAPGIQGQPLDSDFIGFLHSPSSGPNWVAAISINNVTVLNLDTGIPVVAPGPGGLSWNKLTVGVSNGGVSFSIDGVSVASYTGVAGSLAQLYGAGTWLTTQLTNSQQSAMFVDYISMRYSNAR